MKTIEKYFWVVNKLGFWSKMVPAFESVMNDEE